MAAVKRERFCIVQAIAWIQIVLFSLTTLLLILTFLGDGDSRVFKFLQLFTDSMLTTFAYYDIPVDLVVLGVLLFLVGWSLMSIVMANVLLNGVKQKNARWLHWWLMYTTMSLIFGLFWSMYLLRRSTMFIGGSLIVLGATKTTFAISVVFTCKQKMENEGKEKKPKDFLAKLPKRVARRKNLIEFLLAKLFLKKKTPKKHTD